jgi:hypothetical protein
MAHPPMQRQMMVRNKARNLRFEVPCERLHGKDNERERESDLMQV